MNTHCGEGKSKNMSSISSTNYTYMDNFVPNSQEIYNLATGMENMINLHSSTWKEFYSSGGASYSSALSTSNDGFYHFNPENTNESLLPVTQNHGPYIDDSPLRPSQGLSLSLSSTNPSTISLQSFELRHLSDQGFYSKSIDQIRQGNHDHSMNSANQNGFLQIRASKYLGSAQDLLNEFCNLGSKQTSPKGLKLKARELESVTPSATPDSFLDLQKKKLKLLTILEEVDRRYRHYCDQMKVVASSFEAMAGNGAATIYAEMASKAMSRHFRCLRDGIVAQIKATKKVMGEKDISTPGVSRGETPRLRLLDQTLRQQRAFQQMSMMESHPWRPQRGLPERSVSVLRAWLFEHFLHPYPSDVDKHILAHQTGLSRSQVSNWFINARVRLWKPMVEEMYLEETKEQDNILASTEENNFGRPSNSQNLHVEDQKPTLAQLGSIDSECLSSIIINPDKNEGHRLNNNYDHQSHKAHNHVFGRINKPFVAMELDFSSYGHHQGFNTGRSSGSGNCVSLTLGLQQHGENGVNLAFGPTSQGSLFYPTDHMEDCRTVPFSLLDGEAQNLPYRNLMGSQLLHDLAG